MTHYATDQLSYIHFIGLCREYFSTTTTTVATKLFTACGQCAVDFLKLMEKTSKDTVNTVNKHIQPLEILTNVK